MTEKTTPTPEVIGRLLAYDALTGKLTWRERPISMFSGRKYQATWNSRFAGKIAGNVNSHGYMVVKLLGVSYRAHVLIWMLVYGERADDIDHINGDRSDNRLTNLRSVSRSDNMKNAMLSSLNTSGVPGVGWRAREQKWTARAADESGKRISLGYFDSFDDAVAARKAAERKLGYHPNHGRQNRIAA